MGKELIISELPDIGHNRLSPAAMAAEFAWGIDDVIAIIVSMVLTPYRDAITAANVKAAALTASHGRMPADAATHDLAKAVGFATAVDAHNKQCDERKKTIKAMLEPLLSTLDEDLKPAQNNMATILADIRARILAAGLLVLDTRNAALPPGAKKDTLATIRTDDGTTTTITDSYAAQVDDATLLPREFLQPDLTAIDAALKLGTTIAGVSRLRKGSLRIVTPKS